MTFLLGLVQQALRRREWPEPPADLALALAITQLLIDSGHAEAPGSVVVATWRTDSQVAFEVICTERVQVPLSRLLGTALLRPFRVDARAWLLTRGEAEALIDLSVS